MSETLEVVYLSKMRNEWLLRWDDYTNGNPFAEMASRVCWRTRRGACKLRRMRSYVNPITGHKLI